MRHNSRRRIMLSTVITILLGSMAAVALIGGRSRILSGSINGNQTVSSEQSQGAQAKISRRRNLSLQPDAFNLSRRLGHRFLPANRGQSVLIGTLVLGSERQVVQMTRTQTDDGEQVTIALAGLAGTLSWDAAHGAQSSGARASGADRDLIERLVFDSPDQFVLAQLRGASYYQVARMVRPQGATDDYNGPLWNIVRVDDPERDPEKRLSSPWRLYDLNTTTGLIDRIISDVQGQRIVAEVSSWTDVNGEKVPAQIVWTRQGHTVMQYGLTSFSYLQQ